MPGSPLRGAWLAVCLAASPLAAQEPPAAPPAQDSAAAPAGAAQEADLVFEREVFSYPVFQRRNPFLPLLGNESGPRYEQIELRGIIYSADDPTQSVALLALRGRIQQQIQSQVQRDITAQQQGTAPVQDTIYIPDPAQRLRVGQSWGNVRVLQIQRDHVVVEVTEFGLTEQQILRLPIRRQGGPS